MRRIDRYKRKKTIRANNVRRRDDLRWVNDMYQAAIDEWVWANYFLSGHKKYDEKLPMSFKNRVITRWNDKKAELKNKLIEYLKK